MMAAWHLVLELKQGEKRTCATDKGWHSLAKWEMSSARAVTAGQCGTWEHSEKGISAGGQQRWQPGMRGWKPNRGRRSFCRGLGTGVWCQRKEELHTGGSFQISNYMEGHGRSRLPTVGERNYKYGKEKKNYNLEVLNLNRVYSMNSWFSIYMVDILNRIDSYRN